MFKRIAAQKLGQETRYFDVLSISQSLSANVGIVLRNAPIFYWRIMENILGRVSF
jgi:hypothetical protein